jgi:tRNA(guanine-26,N2-N2) methyltransferase
VPNLDNAITLMQRLGTDLPPNASLVMEIAGVDGAQPQRVPLLFGERKDVVDLDPYGTATPFLDSAMQCIQEGGLMLVTCTDSAILCGNYPETCHGKYGGCVSLRIASCHEMGVRIVLANIEKAANRHRKYIVPLLSLHIDFYVRVFVRVYTQPAEVKISMCKMAHLTSCSICSHFQLHPVGIARPSKKQRDKERQEKRARSGGDVDEAVKEFATFPKAPTYKDQGINFAVPNTRKVDTQCPICTSSVWLGGPMYAAPSHSKAFLQELLGTIDAKAADGRLNAAARVRGLVAAAADELEDVPLYHSIHDIASNVKSSIPQSAHFVGALCRLGYRASQVHCHPSAIKTDAPSSVLYGLMLNYKRKEAAKVPDLPDEPKTKKKETAASPVGEAGKEQQGRKGVKLTIQCPELEGDFSYNRQFDMRSGQTGVVKFVPNAPGWGPKARHRGAADK